MIIFWCFFYTQIRFSNVALLTCFQRDNANNQTWLTFYWATPYMTKQSGYKTGNEAAMCPGVDTLQLPASLGKLQSPELRLTNVCNKLLSTLSLRACTFVQLWPFVSPLMVNKAQNQQYVIPPLVL